MKLSIVGAGYVGLVTAACLARLGNTVRVVDIDGTGVEGLRHPAGVRPGRTRAGRGRELR